jgi:hypothetical protein
VVTAEMLAALTHWLGASAAGGTRDGVVQLPKPLYARAHRWGSGFAETSLGLHERCLRCETRVMAS